LDSPNAASKAEMPGTSGQNPLETTKIYTIQGKTFIAEPVFKSEAKESVGAILLRLILSDSKRA
jgi:hypothetical protein